VVDPGGGAFHGPSVQAAAVNAAVDFPAEQAGGFEDAQMFGNGGEGHGEGSGEGVDGGLALREAGEDGATGGIGEGGEGGVEAGGGRGGRIVNHTV
jgi:hypothetical protein